MTIPIGTADYGALAELSVAPLARFTAAAAQTSVGTLAALGARTLYRDGVVYDGGLTSVDEFLLFPPATMLDEDFGLLFVSWLAEPGDPVSIAAASLDPDQVTTHDWDLVLAPVQSNTLYIALFTRQFVAATDAGAPVTVTLGGSRFVTAVAGWWTGAQGVDVLGEVGTRQGASSDVTLAPGLFATAMDGETVVLLFAERSAASATTASLSDGTVQVFHEGAGASASVLLGDLVWPEFGITDDVLASYSTASGDGMGLQVALLPLGATFGAESFLGTEGSLAATGTDTTKNANAAAEGTLAVTGIPVGAAAFGTDTGLAGQPLFFGAAALQAGGTLAALGVPRFAVGADFTATGSPVTPGHPSFARAITPGAGGTLGGTGTPALLSGYLAGAAGTLSTVMTPRAIVTVGLGMAGQLSAQGVLGQSGRTALSAEGGLAAFVSAGLRGTLDLSAEGALALTPVLAQTFGTTTFRAGTVLSAQGAPDFTPISAVGFGAGGLLSAAGSRAPTSPAGITSQPYYVRQTQDWAVVQERQRHIQALYQTGEPVLFVLLWKVEDYHAGLVVACPRCRAEPNSVDARIAAVYQAPQTARCPFCFGTTYSGGVRAKVLRPAIFTDSDPEERRGQRGVTHGESLMVESTDDFRSRTGDFAFRRDGSRWQLGHPQRDQLRTGYDHPSQTTHSLGYARIPAAREDRSSVAYEIPPNDNELAAILTAPLHYPTQ